MAFKVQVGPPQIAIHQGQTVLVTDLDGTITCRAREWRRCRTAAHR